MRCVQNPAGNCAGKKLLTLLHELDNVAIMYIINVC